MAEKNIVVLDWPTSLAALEENGAQPRDPRHIKKYDGNEIDNGWAWGVGTGGGYLKDAIKANSVEDMVSKVLRNLGPGNCIKSLALAGHGSSGNISVGDGSTWQKGGHIDGNRDEWEGPLKRLCDKFCKDPAEIEILLLGCETGVCDKGADKLFELAKFFKECAKGVKGKFCVYGTKRASAADVEEAIKNGRRDHLVRVCSDAEKSPGCLTQPTKDGPKKKERKPREKGKEMRQRFPSPNPKEFTSIAFRDLRTEAGKKSPLAVLSPQPIAVREFLDLYDFSEAYEPAGIPSEIDGQAILFRADGTMEALPICLDYKALVYSVAAEDYLFYLKNLEDRRLVEDLVATGRLKGDC